MKISEEDKKKLQEMLSKQKEQRYERMIEAGRRMDMDYASEPRPVLRTANPALSSNTFTLYGDMTDTESVMSIQGTVNKTLILLFFTLIFAAWVWVLSYSFANLDAVIPWTIGGTLGGFIVAIITVYNKSWAVVTAPIYAALEGLAIGGISSIFESEFPGIVIQAVGLTFGTLLCLLLVYMSRLIKATENFKLGIVAATGGIALVYLANLSLNLFGFSIPYIHEANIIGIGLSVFIVAIAAFNLVLDFDFIEQGAGSRAPKYMEWYASFGLMVTLIWLYLEILRLLAKLRSRRR